MRNFNPKLDFHSQRQSKLETILSGLVCVAIAISFLIFWIDTAALRALTAGFDTYRYAQAYLSLESFS